MTCTCTKREILICPTCGECMTCLTKLRLEADEWKRKAIEWMDRFNELELKTSSGPEKESV